MKKEPKMREVKVGKTTVKLDDLVRDPAGIEDIIADALTDGRHGWPERKLQQIEKPWLNFFPSARDLNEWDQVLLDRYKPVYTPPSDECTSCTLGPCNLLDSKGACGMDATLKMAHESLANSCKGASMQISHARDLLTEALKRFERDQKISHGDKVRYPSINPCVLVGFDVHTLGDADRALIYGEQQLSELLASTTFGCENDVIDLEKKALHAGSVGFLAAELSEIIKESCFGMCSASNVDLIDLADFPHFIDQGVGSVDTSKPVILFSGNSAVVGLEAVEYLKNKGLIDEVEICGVGPAGLDMGRAYEGTKNVGTAVKILKVIRIGLPDVVVAGDQCTHMNILEECKKIGAPVIATTSKSYMGLPDRTDDDAKSIISDLSEGNIPGILVLDSSKAAEIAVGVSQKIAKKRKGKHLCLISDRLLKHVIFAANAKQPVRMNYRLLKRWKKQKRVTLMRSPGRFTILVYVAPNVKEPALKAYQ